MIVRITLITLHFDNFEFLFLLNNIRTVNTGKAHCEIELDCQFCDGCKNLSLIRYYDYYVRHKNW